MRWRWLLLLIFAWGLWQLWDSRAVVHPPGILAPGEPVAGPVEDGPPSLVKNGYQITPLQSFSLDARVLGRERYRFDRGADLSPLDLALGWGRMSDQAVVDSIDITQSGRFYFWHVDRFPIPRREIELHSANMHMIPATDAIERQLLALRSGDVVSLAGYLVNVRGPGGWEWRSSLTREDTGRGACELVWVQTVAVH